MDKVLQFADAVMENVVEPAKYASQPAPWVTLVEQGTQFLKIMWACCQIVEWIGLID